MTPPPDRPTVAATHLRVAGLERLADDLERRVGDLELARRPAERDLRHDKDPS